MCAYIICKYPSDIHWGMGAPVSGGGGECLQCLHGLKLGIEEVQGSHKWNRQWEGTASLQVPPVTVVRLL